MSATALKHLFRDQLTEKAKRTKKATDSSDKSAKNTLGWVYVAPKAGDRRPTSVRTYNSLATHQSMNEYVTFNTFYRNDAREQSALRWINAFSVDIDIDPFNSKFQGDLYLPEVFEAVEAIGLPMPTLVVQTPSGGFHLHWYLEEPVKAFSNKINLFTAISKTIVEELQERGLKADPAAVTPERWWRMPRFSDMSVSEGKGKPKTIKKRNVRHVSEDRYTFESFREWYELEMENRGVGERRNGFIQVGQGLMEAPAIKHMLNNGRNKGESRNYACYTLALAMKASNYEQKRTEEALIAWNQKNSPSLSLSAVKSHVRSAFKDGAKKGPSAAWITKLSGIPFVYTIWEPAKSREDRVYSHYEEWEEDFITHLRNNSGTVAGSQRELAESIKSSVNEGASMPYKTFRKVVENLVAAGKLHKSTMRGRNAKTTLSLPGESNVVEMATQEVAETENRSEELNEFNSNIALEGRVGGQSVDLPDVNTLETLPTSSLDSDLAPVPANVPDYFVSSFWNRGIQDGRVIFTAWGRVQLALKEYGVSYRFLCTSEEVSSVIKCAVTQAFAVKGREISRSNRAKDTFLKYLYGTLKGMYENHRIHALDRFIDEIEGKEMEFELEVLHAKFVRDLRESKAYDPELLELKISEIESELAARSRRSAGGIKLDWLG